MVSSLPDFDLDGGVPMALARGLSVAALCLAFGSLLVRAWLAPPAIAAMPPATAARVRQQTHLLINAALAAAFVTALTWVWLETASIADAETPLETLKAIPAVLTNTWFGTMVGARLAALAAAALLATYQPRRRWLAAACAGLALSLQAGHSHAAAMYQGLSWLLLFDWLHILAAGIWLGTLPGLALLIRRLEPAAAAIAVRRFSPVAAACVATIAASALFQAWVLIGSIPGLVGTANGWFACLKLVLFCVLIAFAAANRTRFTPALRGARDREAAATLRYSIITETLVGLLVVLAAGFLTSLPPAMHLQPTWPFPEMVSFAAIHEDPDILHEVLLAAAALTSAVILLALAVWARRFRLPAAAIAIAALILTLPHFDPLLVPAYPTSFFHSPTNFTAVSIADGAHLFPANCAMCHGPEGHGDGPMAAALPVPPADLTAAHLFMHSDGEMLWWLTNGIPAPNGAPAMPGFAATLSPDQRWHLIDYIRAHNAGLAYAATGDWRAPQKAPAFDMACGNATLSLRDRAGAFLRLIANPPAAPGKPATLSIMPVPATGAVACTTEDEAAPTAYAVLAGTTEANLPGTQFLIDSAGWLRAVQHPGASPSWNDPPVLTAAAATLASHPVSAATAMAGMDMNMDMSQPMSAAPKSSASRNALPKTPSETMEPMKMPM
jgi:putative copper export protein/mono/diheme cytochrome c family protein